MAEKSKQVYKNDVFIGRDHAPVRVLFPPKLDEPTKVGGRGDPKFEITVGFPEDHPDYLTLYQACQEIATEKFGDIDIDGDFELKFKSGDEEYEYYANHKDEKKRREYPQLKGMILLKLRSKNEISVFDVRRRNENGDPIKITDKQEIRDTIYGGCYVSMNLTLATYDAIPAQKRGEPDGDPGVTMYPEQVCFVCDGDRLGGVSKDSGSGFSKVQGAITDEDPVGEDDE